jgi:hypothetical protein
VTFSGGPFDGAEMLREPGEVELAIPLHTVKILESGEKLRLEEETKECMEDENEGEIDNEELNEGVQKLQKGMEGYAESPYYAALYRLEGGDRFVFKEYLDYKAWWRWQQETYGEQADKMMQGGNPEEP